MYHVMTVAVPEAQKEVVLSIVLLAMELAN